MDQPMKNARECDVPGLAHSITASLVPATFINVFVACGFPATKEQIGLTAVFRLNHQEFVMAERRKTTSRKSATRKTTRKPTAKTTTRKAPKRWSQRVTKESDALDLKRGVFKLTSAKKIAASLKRSAERSSRRKSGAYRSALSMLTFYINRAGKTLPKVERERLERAKLELKHEFGRG
jgi:Protein of unknown function (DUF3175)